MKKRVRVHKRKEEFERILNLDRRIEVYNVIKYYMDNLSNGELIDTFLKFLQFMSI